MARNGTLQAAKDARNDEFYTLMPDIERELAHYRDFLRGKVVYCNCDDPAWSNFWCYFDREFDAIGLEGLISSYYEPDGRSYALEVRRNGATGERLPSASTELKGDGDFRSDECVALLDRCDVVITNPPFSLFREYVAQLMVHGRKFIVIGSMNAITYKEIFPLLKDNLMWLGYTSPKRFRQPDGSLKSFGNILWYTNVDIEKRHEPLTLSRRYADDPAAWPRYANYDGIECGRVEDIPADYMGDIGVPITFLTRHCPEQFDIVGISRTLGRPMSEIARPGEYEPGGVRFYIESDGPMRYRRLYDRIVIRRRTAGGGHNVQTCVAHD